MTTITIPNWLLYIVTALSFVSIVLTILDIREERRFNKRHKLDEVKEPSDENIS